MPDTTLPDHPSTDPSWRERAVERSLRGARAKAVTRSDRFIATALEILSETGRTDFTVQELVERSKTSLSSFYQHFSGKDELLLALFEVILATSTAEWRTEVADVDAITGLRLLVERIHGEAGGPRHAGIVRALRMYHLQLAGARPADYARVLIPLRDVIQDLVERGVHEGVLRTDIGPEALATIMMQALVGAAQVHALRSSEDAGADECELLWEFFVGGLAGRSVVVAPA